MNPHGGLRDETIAAAFERRARRAEPGDLRETILAVTLTTRQHRSWRGRFSRALGSPVVRPMWIALLIVATLLAAGVLVVGRWPEGPRLPAEFVWSAFGGGDGIYFAGSNGGALTVDPDGRIWVADTTHDRFAIFDPDGTFVSYWGDSGSGDGQLHLRSASTDARAGVAFAPDGSFYVLDAGNLRVEHFAADRTFVGAWGGPGAGPGRYRQPMGIAVDAGGTVHVLDARRGVVESYDPAGDVVGSLALPTDATGTSLALDSAGDRYVGVCCGAGPNTVLRYDALGDLDATFVMPAQSSQDRPASLAIDASGDLFVTHGPVLRGDTIQVFDRGGQLLAGFGARGDGDGQFGYGFPQIALDGHGSAYVTDGARNRVEKFRLGPPMSP